MGVGIYETTMHFFGPQTCKKPRNFLGFLGWYLFCSDMGAPSKPGTSGFDGEKEETWSTDEKTAAAKSGCRF
jgi:hypothetical protein